MFTIETKDGERHVSANYAAQIVDRYRRFSPEHWDAIVKRAHHRVKHGGFRGRDVALVASTKAR